MAEKLDDPLHGRTPDEPDPVAGEVAFRRLPDDKMILRETLGTGASADDRYKLRFATSGMAYSVQITDTVTDRSSTYWIGPRELADATLDAFREEAGDVTP